MSAGPLPTTEGGFSCVLADPPWSFRTYGGEDMVPTQGAQPYKPMRPAAIRALDVASVCARDCALFLWVVDSNFPEALALGQAWGFTFKTVAFVWVKETKAGWQHQMIEPAPTKMSLGLWTRKESEQCWLFTRGKPPRLDKGVRQVIRAPVREHSRKPDEQFPRIERLVGGPRLELFARERRPGWAAWGDQVGKF